MNQIDAVFEHKCGVPSKTSTESLFFHFFKNMLKKIEPVSTINYSELLNAYPKTYLILPRFCESLYDKHYD